MKIKSKRIGIEMKAAVYARISTLEQEDGTSLDSQLAACLKHAASLGYEVPESLIVRETYSGLSLERPLLTELREKAKNGEFDAFIVYSPDRLSRVGEEILMLVKELKICGVKFITINNQFDDSITGKMVAFILGWSSEMEALMIRERTMRGKRTIAQKGSLPQGCGSGLYGYNWIPSNKKNHIPGRREINEYEARIVKKIFEMTANGDSRFQVAKLLNEQCIPTKLGRKWHPWTIEHIVTNSAYKGETYFGKTCQEGKKRKAVPEDKWINLPTVTPAIIDEVLYSRVERIVKIGKELHRGKKTDNEYLLKGHITCGYCGNFLVGTCLNRRWKYYHCSRTYRTSVRTATCKARYIRANEVEEIVWRKARDIIEHPKILLTELKRRIDAQKNGKSGNDAKEAKEIADINRRMKDYDSREKRLIRLFGIGGIDEQAVNDELTRLHNDKHDDELRLFELTKSKEQLPDLASIELQLNDFSKKIKLSLDNCDLKTKRLVLDILDVQILATPDKLDIKATVPLEFTPIQQTYEYQLHPSKQSGPRKRVRKEAAAIVAEV